MRKIFFFSLLIGWTGMSGLACKSRTEKASAAKSEEDPTKMEHIDKFMKALQKVAVGCDSKFVVTPDQKIIQTISDDQQRGPCYSVYLVTFYSIKMDREKMEITYDPFRTPREFQIGQLQIQGCADTAKETADGILTTPAPDRMDDCAADKFQKPKKVSDTELLYPYRTDFICNKTEENKLSENSIVMTRDVSTEQGNNPATGMWMFHTGVAKVKGKEYKFDHCDIAFGTANPTGLDAVVCKNRSSGAKGPELRLESSFFSQWGRFINGKEEVKVFCGGPSIEM